MTIDVAPGTVALYTDIACGWATLQLHRFYAARAEAGLQEQVRVDHRLFLLEDVNAMALPKDLIDAEVPTFAELAPDFGFRTWRRDPSTWPITTLLANEAVHAVKSQSLRSEERRVGKECTARRRQRAAPNSKRRAQSQRYTRVRPE